MPDSYSISPTPAASHPNDHGGVIGPEPSYRACSIKRSRRTKADIDAVKAAIVGVLRADHPMTVRQLFYQLVVRGVIEKSEEQYQGTVIRLLTSMRMNREIPFSWIIDESRRTRVTETYDNVTDALNHTVKFYRRSALRECSDYIEIWIEKEALSGIVWEVASEYDVPVVVSKGMPSLTQLYQTALAIYEADEAGKRTYLYQFGDHDPSGVLIPETIERRLYELCEKLDCAPPYVERVALTERQIRELALPSRPTKRDGNRHANKFEGNSTELDAMPAQVLRNLVERSIKQHIPASTLNTLRAAEESERELLSSWVAGHRLDGGAS